MLRGCLLALLFWLALSVGYFFWLNTVFEPPTSYWSAALVGFIVFCSLGALLNAKNAYRDWSLLAASRRGLPPRDGRLVAACGTIHPLGEPLQGPFSGAPCVICEYDLSRQRRKADSSGRENTGSNFAGFLMTPCEIRGENSNIKLLGYPVLEGYGDTTHNTYAAARRAIDFLTMRQFENRSGLKMVTVLSIFGELWADEDGSVERNIRLGTVSLPEVFPLELEEEIDRQLLAGEAHAAAETTSSEGGEEDDDEDDDEEFENDEDWEKSVEGIASRTGPDVPQMTEKRVGIGQNVCAIGRFDQLRGGLLPPRGSTTPNRLVRGTAEQLEKKSRAAMGSYLIGGLVALAIVHAATYLVLKVYPHSSETLRYRQEQAFAAAQNGDVRRLESLIRRGMDVNIRRTGGATLLMVASDPAVAAWLIEHGADVNAVDENGQTALMQAASAGHTAIVRQLIEARADLDRRSSNWRRTALMNAVDGGHEEVVSLLRRAGAADDVISGETGQPLAPDGGEPLAAVQAYLDAIHARDPKALGVLFGTGNSFDLASVDWDLWHRVRPVRIESWTGFVRGDDATITASGTSGSGGPVTWIYQLRRTGGQWKIAREKESD